ARTATLEYFVEELAAGKAKYLNDELDAHAKGFAQPTLADFGGLGVKPTFVAAADIDGDGKTDLLVGTATGVKLFRGTGKGFEDATEAAGLAGKQAAAAAFGDADGDGKPDLLL